MGLNYEILKYLENKSTTKQDATKSVQQGLKPISAQEAAAQAKHDYYHPEIKPGITSGDAKVDFLYHNQWLMNTPVIGNYIKNKARDIASRSGGSPIVNMKESGENTEGNLSQTPNYNGSLGKPLAGASMLDQFFSEKPLLKSAKYAPKSDYYPFLPSYSIKGDFDKRISEGKTLTQDDFKKALYNTVYHKSTSDGNGEVPESVYNNFIKTRQPMYSKESYDDDFTRMMGQNLAGHKVGLAWDSEKNLPYVSVADAWDFEPNGYAKKWQDKGNTPEAQKAFIQASLLQKAGKPFKVYDRFYFDPKTREYIPDDKLPAPKTTFLGASRFGIQNFLDSSGLPIQNKPIFGGK